MPAPIDQTTDWNDPSTWDMDGKELRADTEETTRKPHFLEREVQRRLLSEPNFQFPSLVIRRTQNGICLEGILITEDETPDICGLIREIDGVDDIINRLVVCRQGEKSPCS